ncbi:MAG: glycosyltransferase family 87 protein [Alphaproteobacteria bacterium]
MLICLALSVAYVSFWRGDRDGLKHAVGRDFINMWTASRLVEAGRTAEIFDQDGFAAAQRQHLGADFPFHFWSYPPHALLLTWKFSALPYRWAFAVWTLSGLVLMYFAARAFWPAGPWPWFLLLAPSSFVNVFLGQNGFLTAALALGGFALLPRRPVVAGILFGLLTFKPHLGILIPIALIAMRQWPAAAAAALTAALFIGVSVLVHGGDVWLLFWDSTIPYQLRFMAEAEGPFQAMMPSWFMTGRLVGLPLGPVQAVQAVLALAAGVLVYRVFRGGGDWRLKVSLLFVATFLASPQGFNYDMGLVSAAALCLGGAAMEHGWRRGEFTAAALCWTLPLTVMPLNALGAPIGPLLLAGMLA